jgi:hypothetical protein
MIPRSRFAFGTLLCLCATLCWSAVAAAADSSALFLPDEALAVVRFPAPAEVIKTLREKTKFGTVLFSPERVAKMRELVESEGGEGWTSFLENLEKYNLKPEDGLGLLEGEIGGAFLSAPREGQKNLLMWVYWIEPEKDLGDRLYAALEKVIEEDQATEYPVNRVDLNLAGYNVMRVAQVVGGPKPVEMEEEFPDADDEEAMKRYMEKYEKLQAEAKIVQVDQLNYFVARRENRFLIGMTQPNSGRTTSDEEETAPNWDEVSGIEAATELFGKFLALHESGETGIVQKALSAPGVADSLPEGQVFMEMFLDFPSIISLSQKNADEKALRMLELTGMKGMGPMSYRGTVDGNVIRFTGMLSLPQPRSGALTLFEQELLPSEPIEWAPASAVGYTHVSFDLVKLYEKVKELSIAEEPETATEQFETLERQCNGLFQTDVAGLLGSLGKRHTVITLMPELNPQIVNPDMPTAPMANRVAFVWQLGDEAVWQKVIQLGAAFAGSSGGAVTSVEEQGFKGLRLTTPTFQGGVFVGQNYLMVGIGPGVVENVLSTLKNPPALADSLRGSELMQRAGQLMPLEPGIAFQISDNGRLLPVQREAFLKGLDIGYAAEAGPGAEQNALMQKIKALVPSEEEMQGLMGVSISHATVNEHGLILRTASELPAP